MVAALMRMVLAVFSPSSAKPRALHVPRADYDPVRLRFEEECG